MRFLYPIVFILFFGMLTAFVIKAPEMAMSHTSDGYANSGELLDGELPMGFNTLFAGSGECELCHSSMVNNQGQSISIIDDWRSTMMANAARDPFWRAKVSHETLVNPEHAEVLEDVCTRCHAPLGHFDAHYNGQQLYSIEEMENDPLAMDGVSCTVCHQVTEASLGNYSGEIIFGEDQQIWGPYEDPFPNPMIMHTGFTPVYGPHIKDSRVCASCHTLITNTVDMSGIPTGTQFVEQAIYHEWLNSTFQTTGIGCQNCHIPEIPDNVVISTMPPWLDGRSPFGLHQLVGANVFMLRLMRDNSEALGLTATTAQFDTTIARAMNKLQVQSLMLQVSQESRTTDTLEIQVSLQNLTGHKLPSGYPSRRMFISLEVSTLQGETIFHSGEMDADYNLIHENDDFEPHYVSINDPQQVQIYEMVMGNVDLEPTTVLEQAYEQLKDNRIPPSGFTTDHASYDTVEIVGNALQDLDFNHDGNTEGTGKDIVRYLIPINGSTQELLVSVKVYYQTVSNKWLEHMFEYTSTEIDAFKSYYEEADKTPVIMAEENMNSLYTAMIDHPHRKPMISPNPAGNYIHIQGVDLLRGVKLYALDGTQLVSPEIEPCNPECFKIKSPVGEVCAIVQFTDGQGQLHTQKVLLK